MSCFCRLCRPYVLQMQRNAFKFSFLPSKRCFFYWSLSLNSCYGSTSESRETLRESHDSPPFWKSRGVLGILWEVTDLFTTPWHSSYAFLEDSSYKNWQIFSSSSHYSWKNREKLIMVCAFFEGSLDCQIFTIWQKRGKIPLTKPRWSFHFFFNFLKLFYVFALSF